MAECLEFLVRNLPIPHVPQHPLGIVLPAHHEHLEDLPAERLQPRDHIGHVLGVVQATDDSIELELDIIHAAPVTDVEEPLHIIAIAPPDANVGLLVERVARHGQHVDIAAMLTQELLSDLGAVCDDGGGFEMELLLAVAQHGRQELGLQERLTACNVELLHAGLAEEVETAVGLFLWQHV